MLVVTGCGSSSHQAPQGSVRLTTGTGTVSVLYAGSLTQLMERKLAPAYGTATGFSFQGEGKGSVAAANQIKDRTRAPDVFVSADPAVNQLLQGQAGGGYVSWWEAFAGTEIVVGWSPHSRFAPKFEAAVKSGAGWEKVLEQPGLRLGRTDPELDPKGYRTIMALDLDGTRLRDPGLSRRILGPAGNPAQIFPEEQLVARLQSGELDAGFFYAIEAVEASLPYLRLPAEINMGNPNLAAAYAKATFTTAKGTVVSGSPIEYTATIPNTVRNRDGALAFVQFLTEPAGVRILAAEGLATFKPRFGGDLSTVPAQLR